MYEEREREREKYRQGQAGGFKARPQCGTCFSPIHAPAHEPRRLQLPVVELYDVQCRSAIHGSEMFVWTFLFLQGANRMRRLNDAHEQRSPAPNIRSRRKPGNLIIDPTDPTATRSENLVVVLEKSNQSLTTSSRYQKPISCGTIDIVPSTIVLSIHRFTSRANHKHISVSVFRFASPPTQTPMSSDSGRNTTKKV